MIAFCEFVKAKTFHVYQLFDFNHLRIVNNREALVDGKRGHVLQNFLVIKTLLIYE